MCVLILGNHTQGLGIIRSLSRIGLDIHLVNDRVISLSRFSKYLTKYHSLKKNALKFIYLPENEAILLDFINQLIPKGAEWPVFSVNEDIIHFLYQNRPSFGGRLWIPDNPIMDIVDKYRFSQEMEKIGLLTPKTYLLSNFNDILLKKSAYLCKGRIGNRFRNISNLKGRLVKNTADLKSLRRSISKSMSENDVLVQEKIHQNSEVYSCCGLAIEGKLYRYFQYVKLRQHPDEFGTGTFLKSIRDPIILEQALLILKHFFYTGIFEIEFIRNEDGLYSVLEMNPRTWKSIHFATQCGQNICAEYVKYIRIGMIPNKNYNYAVDKTWVDLGTDIPMLLKNGPFAYPGYDRNIFFSVLDRKDLLPFLMEILLAPFIVIGI